MANDIETGKITAILEAIGDQPREIRQEIAGAAEEIGLDAQWRTPVDKGNLKASKNVRHTKTESSITFGGPNAPYAPMVHDNQHAYHKTGESGFLIKAIEAALPELEEQIRDIVRKSSR